MSIKGPVILALGVALALSAGAAVTAQGPAKQPVFTTLKADFIPGEKTIFYDDFTDMAPGDAPARFKVRGSASELKAGGELRELSFSADGSLTPNLKALPANFTFESDITFDAPRGWVRNYVVFFSKDKEVALWIVSTRANGGDTVFTTRVPKTEELARKPLKMNLAEPVRLALWIQDGRVRAFVNGEKQVDVNQVELPPIDRVEIRPTMAGAGNSVGYRMVRFAESAPDVSQVFNASGRYVTHGILFDTDSDRLKPESAYVIQGIAKALTATPALKLLIEGHTDASGNAAHNMDLSKRRAEAVKSVLVSQFNVEAARLTAAGVGSTKPIDSNETAQGRAQNRRVEFVKQ